MGFIVIGALVLSGIYLVPRIRNWVYTVHCPRCGKWFRLEYQSFVVTDSVVGHHSTRTGGGNAFNFLGLFFLGGSRTRDDPFIREWGEVRYICRACGSHISIHNVKRDR